MKPYLLFRTAVEPIQHMWPEVLPTVKKGIKNSFRACQAPIGDYPKTMVPNPYHQGVAQNMCFLGVWPIYKSLPSESLMGPKLNIYIETICCGPDPQ